MITTYLLTNAIINFPMFIFFFILNLSYTHAPILPIYLLTYEHTLYIMSNLQMMLFTKLWSYIKDVPVISTPVDSTSLDIIPTLTHNNDDALPTFLRG